MRGLPTSDQCPVSSQGSTSSSRTNFIKAAEMVASMLLRLSSGITPGRAYGYSPL